MSYLARAHLDMVVYRRDWARRSAAVLGVPYPPDVLERMEYENLNDHIIFIL
jgi:hypothetical protein